MMALDPVVAFATLTVLLLLILVKQVVRVRAMAERLQQHVMRDPLTGAGNRVCLNDSLARAIAGAQRDGRKAAVLYIDLKGFRDVSDRRGQDVSDRLLCEAAALFSENMRAGDVLARLRRDQFAVVLTHVRSKEDAESVVERLLALEIRSDGETVRPRIGYCIYPDESWDSEELVRKPDTSMYHQTVHHLFTARALVAQAVSHASKGRGGCDGDPQRTAAA